MIFNMRKQFTLLYFILLTQLIPVMSQPKIDGLKKQLQQEVDNFDGRAGLYFFHLDREHEIAIQADELFPTASMVKIPIMIKIFDMIEQGQLSYDQNLTYRGKHTYTYEDDLINIAQKGSEIPVSKLLAIMMSLSDNTASLWLQHRAGTGIAINKWLTNNGYTSTRVNSRTKGREKSYEKYGWGQTTPREMAQLMLDIYHGKVVSQTASEKMYRIMTRSYWDGEALSVLPPEIQAASKQGAVAQSKSEVLLVHSPGGDYVFCAITDDQQIQGYEYNNPGFIILRNVSQIIFEHYNPDIKYTPEKPEKYW